ncbi:polyprenyl synthetase family protein [Streptomyces sp. ALI-76-A]|uniref:polyprenyl synthetase family protein n=1 Tax=Streptomyces sp. ALI-76-A TaxID=3025736 RepID=UPI00256EEF2F|nr:polyprenyl synthetase family protein [Streptomyces sp. ALI-76-A]MDL5205823.1 polyprenyl synthetase family protein [Streptomyces sp. ALI-76-A]
MSPTAAREHRADRRPRDHLVPGHGSPDRPDRPHATLSATAADAAADAHQAGTDDARTVDADVAGAVLGVLSELLTERVAAAETVDPLFAQDLAARVARFTQYGGKLSRPRLVWWALRACGGAEPPATRAALRVGAALELIQTCALVHDDVMDDASLRRGRPALHVDVAAQYAGADHGPRGTRLGRAAAILAGDLALAWADDVLAETELPAHTVRRVRQLWSAMRTEMVAGQYLDVHGEATSARSLVRAIRAACLKSALYSVERPLALGAALADADPATTRALCSAGRCVGLAFQLRDDLLDVFGDPRDTGKPSGGDLRSGKPTYLAAVAQARAETADDPGALAVLRGTLGRSDASETELAAVREVFTATGARETVESKIDRLVAQGLRHLDAATLDPHGRRHLHALLRSAAGTSAAQPGGTTAADPGGTPAAHPDGTTAVEAGGTPATPPGGTSAAFPGGTTRHHVVPVSLLLTATDQETPR